MAVRFNPFTGQLDLVAPKQTAIDTAEKIADIFGCLASVSVGDVVVPSTTVSDHVDTLSTNAYDNLAFGVVIEKISLTSCKVLVSGKLTGAAFGISGLTFGKAVFIGTDGSLTTTVPVTGHRQKMGMAIKSDSIFLLPSLEKVVLS